MNVTSTQFKHCDLVKVEGRIDSGTAPKLAEVMNSLTDEGRFKVVLDMSGVDFISSAGLRVLVNTQKVCKRYNRGEIMLAAVPDKIHAALDLAGFVPLFRLYDDVLKAVGSL